MDPRRKVKAAHPAAADEDFEIRDDSDGRGPFISRWNEAKLRPQP